MNKAWQAVKELHQADRISKHTFLVKVNPVARLISTVGYIVFLLSFPKYDLSGVLFMALIPVILAELGDISIFRIVKKCKGIMILLLFVGSANLLLDREIAAWWGEVPITGGIFSFLTLYLKGFLAFICSYILLTSSGMDDLCYAFSRLKVPDSLIVVIMLTYRYLIVLLKETGHVVTAYGLRAPGQKGIHIRAWGSLAGSILLRSMERGEAIYESMELRGFQGKFYVKADSQGSVVLSVIFCLGILGASGVFRIL